MQKIKLDSAKLLGFRLDGLNKVKTGGKTGGKDGIKIGEKAGTKVGVKPVSPCSA